MKDIKITIEDEDQKAFIVLKEVGEDEANVNATFEPPIDNTKDEKPIVVCLAFRILRGLGE